MPAGLENGKYWENIFHPELVTFSVSFRLTCQNASMPFRKNCEWQETECGLDGVSVYISNQHNISFRQCHVILLNSRYTVYIHYILLLMFVCMWRDVVVFGHILNWLAIINPNEKLQKAKCEKKRKKRKRCLNALLCLMGS